MQFKKICFFLEMSEGRINEAKFLGKNMFIFWSILHWLIVIFGVKSMYLYKFVSFSPNFNTLREISMNNEAIVNKKHFSKDWFLFVPKKKRKERRDAMATEEWVINVSRIQHNRFVCRVYVSIIHNNELKMANVWWIDARKH